MLLGVSVEGLFEACSLSFPLPSALVRAMPGFTRFQISDSHLVNTSKIARPYKSYISSNQNVDFYCFSGYEILNLFDCTHFSILANHTV